MAERYIYFIQAITGGPIKIGSAVNIADRIKSLQTGSASPLCLLVSVVGTVKDERALHRQLREYRFSGEWFSPDGEVLAVISAAKAGLKISEIIRKADRPTWTPRSDDEATLRKTFAEALIAAYGRKHGWRLRVAQDAGVSTECVKRWMQRRCLPQCVQLITLARSRPEIREWVLTVMVPIAQKDSAETHLPPKPLQPSLLFGEAA